MLQKCSDVSQARELTTRLSLSWNLAFSTIHQLKTFVPEKDQCLLHLLQAH